MIKQLAALAQGRSWRWPKTRAKFLLLNNTCQACGVDKNLDVHHILPVHTKEGKEQELDFRNLITLCRRCHRLIGHLDNWRGYNPHVVEDAEYVRSMFGHAKRRD